MLLSTVEVMDTEMVQWSVASSLPHPIADTSATVCGDCVYMLEGFDEGGKTKSVLTCSLPDLLRSCQPSLEGQLQNTLANQPTVWRMVADLPVYNAIPISSSTYCWS